MFNQSCNFSLITLGNVIRRQIDYYTTCKLKKTKFIENLKITIDENLGFLLIISDSNIILIGEDINRICLGDEKVIQSLKKDKKKDEKNDTHKSNKKKDTNALAQNKQMNNLSDTIAIHENDYHFKIYDIETIIYNTFESIIIKLKEDQTNSQEKNFEIHLDNCQPFMERLCGIIQIYKLSLEEKLFDTTDTTLDIEQIKNIKKDKNTKEILKRKKQQDKLNDLDRLLSQLEDILNSKIPFEEEKGFLIDGYYFNINSIENKFKNIVYKQKLYDEHFFVYKNLQCGNYSCKSTIQIILKNELPIEYLSENPKQRSFSNTVLNELHILLGYLINPTYHYYVRKIDTSKANENYKKVIYKTKEAINTKEKKELKELIDTNEKKEKEELIDTNKKKEKEELIDTNEKKEKEELIDTNEKKEKEEKKNEEKKKLDHNLIMRVKGFEIKVIKNKDDNKEYLFNIYFIRRMFIPPFFESFKDITIIQENIFENKNDKDANKNTNNNNNNIEEEDDDDYDEDLEEKKDDKPKQISFDKNKEELIVNLSNVMKTIVEYIQVQEFKKPNNVSNKVIQLKLESYLLDKQSFHYLYNFFDFETNETIKFIKSFKARFILIYDIYNAIDHVKEQLNTLFEVSKKNSAEMNKFYNSIINKSHNEIINELLNKVMNQYFTTEEEKKQIYAKNKQINNEIIEKSNTETKKIDDNDKLSYLLIKNKLLNMLSYTLLDPSFMTVKTKKGKIVELEDAIDICNTSFDLTKEIYPLLKDLLNILIVTNSNEILLNEPIKYILKNTNNIQHITFNEDIFCLLVKKNIFMSVHEIDSYFVYFEFLGYVLKHNFSYNILKHFTCYLESFTAKYVKINKEKGNFMSEEAQNIVQLTLPPILELYIERNNNYKILIYSIRCILCFCNLVDSLREKITNDYSLLSNLYYFLNSPHKELIYYSFLLVKTLSTTSIELISFLRNNKIFFDKFLDILNGMKIENCYYDPYLLLLIMQYLEKMVKDQIIKEFIKKYKPKTFIETMKNILSNPQKIINLEIDDEDYYIDICTLVYKILTKIVYQNFFSKIYLDYSGPEKEGIISKIIANHELISTKLENIHNLISTKLTKNQDEKNDHQQNTNTEETKREENKKEKKSKTYVLKYFELYKEIILFIIELLYDKCELIKEKNKKNENFKQIYEIVNNKYLKFGEDFKNLIDFKTLSDGNKEILKQISKIYKDKEKFFEEIIKNEDIEEGNKEIRKFFEDENKDEDNKKFEGEDNKSSINEDEDNKNVEGEDNKSSINEDEDNKNFEAEDNKSSINQDENNKKFEDEDEDNKRIEDENEDNEY